MCLYSRLGSLIFASAGILDSLSVESASVLTGGSAFDGIARSVDTDVACVG